MHRYPHVSGDHSTLPGLACAAILGATDLAAWSALAAVINPLGSIDFTDATAHLSQQKF
jgi:hypothetical protein